MAVDLVIRSAKELLTFAGGRGPLIGTDLGEIGRVDDGALLEVALGEVLVEGLVPSILIAVGPQDH